MKVLCITEEPSSIFQGILADKCCHLITKLLVSAMYSLLAKHCKPDVSWKISGYLSFTPALVFIVMGEKAVHTIGWDGIRSLHFGLGFQPASHRSPRGSVHVRMLCKGLLGASDRFSLGVCCSHSSWEMNSHNEVYDPCKPTYATKQEVRPCSQRSHDLIRS